MMKIDKRLNLVIPVETDGQTVYVHSTPISPEMFSQHYLVIAKTFSAIHGEGLGATAGPRIAAMMLKDIAMRSGVWEGPLGVEAGLMNEVRRLSNVIVPSEKDGWSTITLHEAITKGMIDATDKEVLENAIVFFIVVSAMHRAETLKGMLEAVCGLWSAQTTSLNSTAFAASLPTSTVTGNSGETQTGLLVPS